MKQPTLGLIFWEELRSPQPGLSPSSLPIRDHGGIEAWLYAAQDKPLGDAKRMFGFLDNETPRITVTVHSIHTRSGIECTVTVFLSPYSQQLSFRLSCQKQ